MRIVILGSGRGTNAEAILHARATGRLGRAEVAAIFSDQSAAGILALGARFGVPATHIDSGPFRTKLEGEGEARMVAAVQDARPDLVVLAGFMRVLKPGFLNAFAGCVVGPNGLVLVTGNGGGSRFGAQHSQSVENWCMMIPGLKVVAPSSPLDVIGLLAAAVRDPDPVIFLEHKSLYASKGEVPDGEILDTLGTAKILRPGKDATILALALMVPRALEAAERLKAEHGIDCEVVDVRSLVPLDTQTILSSIGKTHRCFSVEENPRLCGWGAEIMSIIADEAFYELDGPLVRITTPHVPLPAADILEDMILPTVDRIVERIRTTLKA